MPVAFRVEYAVAARRNGRPDVHGSGRGVVREQVGEALVQKGQDPAVLDQGRPGVLPRQRHGIPVRPDAVVFGRGTAKGADGRSRR